MIGTTLTTATASSVILTNGAPERRRAAHLPVDVAGRGLGTTKGTNGKGAKNGSASSSKAGAATMTRGKKTAAGVTAAVHGRRIRKVTVTDNGVRVGGPGSPHKVLVPGTPGVHRVTVHVTFTDSLKSKTFKFHFRVPTPVLHPHGGSSQFTG